VDLETPFRSLLSDLGLDLYDLEMVKGTLNVVVTRPGGVDLEALTKANRVISEWLDVNDPIAGRFTLDVSSPGFERKLRTPAHFLSTVGEVVTLRELRGGQPTRRLEGTVVAADERTSRCTTNNTVTSWSRSATSSAPAPSLSGGPKPSPRHRAPRHPLHRRGRKVNHGEL
jgi:ribosome maturation factor RimP